MEPRKAVGWLALAVAVLGVALALWPTSVAGGRVGCGSALSPSSSEASAEEFGDSISDVYAGGDGSDNGGYVALCDDRVGSQRLVAFPVIGLGVLVGAFLVVTAAQTKPAPILDDSAGNSPST
jgi:hypothetical protein